MALTIHQGHRRIMVLPKVNIGSNIKFTHLSRQQIPYSRVPVVVTTKPQDSLRQHRPVHCEGEGSYFPNKTQLLMKNKHDLNSQEVCFYTDYEGYEENGKSPFKPGSRNVYLLPKVEDDNFHNFVSKRQTNSEVFVACNESNNSGGNFQIYTNNKTERCFDLNHDNNHVMYSDQNIQLPSNKVKHSLSTDSFHDRNLMRDASEEQKQPTQDNKVKSRYLDLTPSKREAMEMNRKAIAHRKKQSIDRLSRKCQDLRKSWHTLQTHHNNEMSKCLESDHYVEMGILKTNINSSRNATKKLFSPAKLNIQVYGKSTDKPQFVLAKDPRHNKESRNMSNNKSMCQKCVKTCFINKSQDSKLCISSERETGKVSHKLKTDFNNNTVSRNMRKGQASKIGGSGENIKLFPKCSSSSISVHAFHEKRANLQKLIQDRLCPTCKLDMLKLLTLNIKEGGEMVAPEQEDKIRHNDDCNSFKKVNDWLHHNMS